MTHLKLLSLATAMGILLPGAGMADDDLLRVLIRGMGVGPVYHVARDDDDDDGYRGRYVRGDHGHYRHVGRIHRDDDDDDDGWRDRDDNDDDD